MRIPQSFIDELLTRTDIISIIEQYIPLKKAGGNYKALCPFHNEKSPSFSVSASKQFYYCFGCGASGNAISFLIDYERLGFVDAIESLASRAGLEIPKDAHAQTQTSNQQALYEVMQKAAQHYMAQLRLNDPAKNYLKQRGLSGEVAQQFQVGFAPTGWDNLLKALGTSVAQRDLLATAGLSTTNENGRVYDRFRERIMFPIRDRRGRVIAFGGRVLDNSTPKYLNSPETPIFHKSHELFGLYEARQANRHLEKLIVVEGYMDVIALAQHGITYAVATLGTAITTDHLQRLLRSCKQVFFCFDGDTAGEKAAWKALEVALPILNDQVQVGFLFLPRGEDPDSMIRKDGKDKFEDRFANAMSLTSFLLDHLSEQANLETIDGRAQLVSLVIPYIEKVSAPVTHELLLDALAKITRTEIDKLRYWSNRQEATPSAAAATKHASNFNQTPIRLAISLLLQHPELTQQTTLPIPTGKLPGLPLLEVIFSQANENTSATTASLIEHWRNKPEFKHLAKLASTDILTPHSGLLAEFNDCLRRIQQLSREQKIERLMVKAVQEQLSPEEKQILNELLKQRKSD